LKEYCRVGKTREKESVYTINKFTRIQGTIGNLGPSIHHQVWDRRKKNKFPEQSEWLWQ